MNESFWNLCTLFFLVVQIAYWLLIFNKLALKKAILHKSNLEPVSIVICARNAKIQLTQNLPAFLAQDYPEFELILVDDDSEDGTEQWVISQMATNPKLKYYRNHKTAEGKKQALTLGISKASYPWIALSDADCSPGSPFWLKTMMSNDLEDTKIVLAYAPYNHEAEWLNKLIRYETCLNAIQYLSASILRFPYMGTGRNLVYHKSIFDINALQSELAYGDDDLLISKKATAENTVICLDPDSFIYSTPETNYKDYFNQKWRHFASSHEYNWKIKCYLFGFFASFIGLYGSIVFAIFFNHVFFTIGCLLIHLSISWPVFCKQSKLLNEKNLCIYYPILNLIYLIHIVIQVPFLWIKKKRW